MPVRWRRAVVLGLAALSACGGDSPDFMMGDTAVVVHSDARFVRQPDFPDRLARTVATGLAYWGGTWRHLAGKAIVLQGGPYVACGHAHRAVACYDGDITISTRDPAFAFSCVEQTALVHEIGHAVIGDADHEDPRWTDFRAVERALSGHRGYPVDGGDAPCVVYPSVWRHAPGRSTP